MLGDLTKSSNPNEGWQKKHQNRHTTLIAHVSAATFFWWFGFQHPWARIHIAYILIQIGWFFHLNNLTVLMVDLLLLSILITLMLTLLGTTISPPVLHSFFSFSMIVFSLLVGYVTGYPGMLSKLGQLKITNAYIPKGWWGPFFQGFQLLVF